ncbi:MAG: AhpC/TSA family protein [Odoribacter sp.]|nr:AhpC/TSA family protein [Odoribacter sp.]
MKKILFPAAAIAFSLAACVSTPKYTINGTIEGEQASGNAFLVKNSDTLAKAVITDGKFVLTGNVDHTTNAQLTIEGKRMGLPVILENVDYTAVINFTNPMESKVEGPENQKIINDYMAINMESRSAQSKLYKEYSEAAKANDTAKIRQLGKTFDKLEKEATKKQDALIKNNADTYAAALILTNKMGGMDAEELSKEFENLGPNAQASEAGQAIAERIKKIAAVAVGQVAPDFTLNTPDGKPLSMHSIKGKVKIIDFWASWCGPCRGENPNVVKIYKEFHPKGLEILGVSLDNTKEAWLKAIEDDKLTWNHVSDLKGWGSEAAQLYAVNGIPHMVVLDENNVIVAKNLRGDALRAKVAEMLK